MPSAEIEIDVPRALLAHAGVLRVVLTGSRARGDAGELSDWDFRVDTRDFDAVSRDLPGIAVGLGALAWQWDRLSEHGCFMLMLEGAVKIDLLFLDEPHEALPPWKVSEETLEGIDWHFWDWTIWLASKQAKGKMGLVEAELGKMFEHLLRPMEVHEAPSSIEGAVTAYERARDKVERKMGISVERRVGDVVRERLRGHGFDG